MSHTLDNKVTFSTTQNCLILQNEEIRLNKIVFGPNFMKKTIKTYILYAVAQVAAKVETSSVLSAIL